MLRVAIVDDEPLVRSGLRALLEPLADVTIVAECRHGTEAVEAIRETRPALAFLDVQMPGLDGFGVLAALAPEERPAVVFVTAFDQYAVRAFDLHAVDYLLKPFDDSRFHTALTRARARLAESTSEEGHDRLERLLAEQEGGTPRVGFPERLAVREGGELRLVPVSEIDWIEAADNYVRLYRGERYSLLREPLSRLEGALDPAVFARIHRSVMVNLARIESLVPLPGGEYEVRLSGGRRLTLSRGYRDRLLARFHLPE